MMEISRRLKQQRSTWRGYSALIILLLAIAIPAAAQRTGHSAPPGHGQTPNLTASQRAHHGARRTSTYASPYTSLPFPFFSDIFDSGDIYSTGYPVASDPPPFLMEAARGMAGPSTASMGAAMPKPGLRESSRSQPLMIELQNGRYVKVTNAAIDGEALPLKQSGENAVSAKPSAKFDASPNVAVPGRDTLPALLIFRDGHREEVRDYTIAAGVLYARGDFYADGYWSKKIELAALDLPQTVQANANRNVKFMLPASPIEVVTSF